MSGKFEEVGIFAGNESNRPTNFSSTPFDAYGIKQESRVDSETVSRTVVIEDGLLDNSNVRRFLFL